MWQACRYFKLTFAWYENASAVEEGDKDQEVKNELIQLKKLDL